jgi:hypothetical protein
MKQQRVRIKNNRPVGQGETPREAQVIVAPISVGHNLLGYLPTIPGQLPKIAYVVRTTAVEKALTLSAAE